MAYTKKQNGYLLEANPNKEDVADAIVSLVKELKDPDTHIQIREASINVWRQKFDADKNAEEFCSHIRSLYDDTEEISRVVVVTNGYPFGGERSFIENEITEIYKRYKLTIIAVKDGELSEKADSLCKENVERIKRLSGQDTSDIEVYLVDLTWSFIKYFVFLFEYFRDKRIKKEISKIKEYGHGCNRFVMLWESMKYYAKARLFSDFISRQNIDKSENVVFYSFWHIYSTLGICFDKHIYPNSRIITRAHGYDLYDERWGKAGRQPFREVMEDYLDSLIFACDYGKEYYINRNKLNSSSKYLTGYLGTKVLCKQGNKDKIQDGDCFRIVSCSNLIPLKRVDYIIDAIKIAHKQYPGIAFEWIHFGDGVLRNDLELYAQKVLGAEENITFCFKGKIDNDHIHEYYANNRVDCFITTSSTEGLPISIIEAMSYGIPIIATDVGGIREVFV